MQGDLHYLPLFLIWIKKEGEGGWYILDWNSSGHIDLLTVMLPYTNCMSYLTTVTIFMYHMLVHSSSLDLVYHSIFSS